MQESERISQKVAENVIFDSSLNLALNTTSETQAVGNIMEIPGTAHEKLLALSEMI
jgi:hypothetical protein